jgi:predicted dehydrogenase
MFGVGIVGAGWVATEHIRAFESNPDAKVVAICSRSVESAEAKVKEMKSEAGCRLSSMSPPFEAEVCESYEEMLKRSDVDVVCIATPNNLHFDEVMKASEAGKHMLIEKPAALELEQLAKMRDSVRSSGVKTVVGFVLRWNPLFDIIKSTIDNEMLGKIYYQEADYQHNIGDWARGWWWYGKAELGGGSLLGAGIHAVDALRWFAGHGIEKTMDITEVYAYSGGHRRQKGEMDYDGFIVAIMKMKDDSLAKVSSNWDCIMPYRFPIEIFGSEGTIKDNRLYSNKLPGQTDFVTIPTILPDSGEVSHHPFQPEIDHLIDCIKTGTESHCNLADSINAHEACIAANMSSETGKTIELPLI